MSIPSIEAQFAAFHELTNAALAQEAEKRATRKITAVYFLRDVSAQRAAQLIRDERNRRRVNKLFRQFGLPL